MLLCQKQACSRAGSQQLSLPTQPGVHLVVPPVASTRQPTCKPSLRNVTTRALPVPPADSGSISGSTDDANWAPQGIPSYLQSFTEESFCEEAAALLDPSESENNRNIACELLWKIIRRESEDDAAHEPILSSFLYASILAHDSFERSLAFILSNRLANNTMLPTQLFELFFEVLSGTKGIKAMALADLHAHRDRDPACSSYSQALLYFKGYHSIQAQRIAHTLWERGQKVMALALQSRISEVLAVDIHPGARLGYGILLDHGTGVVIGETAVLGNNCSILQHVTLGGTGKETGDRHPKVEDNVLIGAGATILGNIRIGKGAQIAAGALVLKPVPPHTMIAGSPAKEMGKVEGNPAADMQHDCAKRNLLMGELLSREAAKPQPQPHSHSPYGGRRADNGSLAHRTASKRLQAAQRHETGLPGHHLSDEQQRQQLMMADMSVDLFSTSTYDPAVDAANGMPVGMSASEPEALQGGRGVGASSSSKAAGVDPVALQHSVAAALKEKEAQHKWPGSERKDPEYTI